MKKLGFVLGVTGLVCVTTPAVGVAQTAAKNAMTPAEDLNAKADRHTAQAVKELGLNDEQKSKFRKFEIDRLYRVQPINEKLRSISDEKEKERLREQKRQINEDFFKNVSTILTPAQQEIWKKKKEELMEKKQH